MKTDNKSTDKNHSFLTFVLDGEHFAVPVNNVMEIMETCTITQIPNAPKTIVGIFNFRGEVAPLIDMHYRFNCTNDKVAKMIIVVDLEIDKKTTLIGLQVDDVKDVLEFSTANIRQAPKMGIRYSEDFLEGVVEVNKEFVMVLNIEKVLDFGVPSVSSAA